LLNTDRIYTFKHRLHTLSEKPPDIPAHLYIASCVQLLRKAIRDQDGQPFNKAYFYLVYDHLQFRDDLLLEVAREYEDAHGQIGIVLPQKAGEPRRPRVAIKVTTIQPSRPKRPPSPSQPKRIPSPSRPKRPPSPSQPKRPPSPSQPKRPPSPSQPKRPPSPSQAERPPSPSQTKRPPSPSQAERPPSPSQLKRPPSPSQPKRPPSPSQPKRPPSPSKPKRTPSLSRLKRPPSPSQRRMRNEFPRLGPRTPLSAGDFTPITRNEWNILMEENSIYESRNAGLYVPIPVKPVVGCY